MLTTALSLSQSPQVNKQKLQSVVDNSESLIGHTDSTQSNPNNSAKKWLIGFFQYFTWRKPLFLSRKWNIVRLAQISENAILRLMAACTVSYVDLDGIRHSVEVEAEGLYEASVLGMCAFRKHDLWPAGLTELEVEVHSSVKHTLSVRKVQDWLQRGVRTPKEAVLKERLRNLLST